jgi:hypothetical protein
MKEAIKTIRAKSTMKAARTIMGKQSIKIDDTDFKPLRLDIVDEESSLWNESQFEMSSDEEESDGKERAPRLRKKSIFER